MTRHGWRTGTALVLMGFIAGAAHGGVLRMGNPQLDGEHITIPVLLEGDVGQGVSTMDFQLNYDPGVLEPVAVTQGVASRSAGKQVQANKRGDGEYKIVVVGLNQNTVSSGEVANVIFQRVGSQGGRTDLHITASTLSSAQAEEIPSSGSRASIDLEGGRIVDEEVEPESVDPARDPANGDRNTTATRADRTVGAPGAGTGQPDGPQAGNRGEPRPVRPRATPSGPAGAEGTTQPVDLAKLAEAMQGVNEARMRVHGSGGASGEDGASGGGPAGSEGVGGTASAALQSPPAAAGSAGAGAEPGGAIERTDAPVTRTALVSSDSPAGVVRDDSTGDASGGAESTQVPAATTPAGNAPEARGNAARYAGIALALAAAAGVLVLLRRRMIS